MLLKSFRNASHSPVIKILFVAIIFSFCLWGVGDIIRNYSASKSVFTVDKTRVIVDQFVREYTDEKQKIRNRGSRPLSDAEMEAYDIKGMVLNRLLNDAVFEGIYSKLGIIIPKKTILDVVHSRPEFQIDGKFDPRAYEMAIRRSGLSEQSLLFDLRNNLARTQLIHPIVTGYRMPKIVKEAIVREFESKKTFLVTVFDIDSVRYDKPVSNEEISQFYQSSSEKYKRPESRDVSLLIIDYRNLVKDLDIDEAEVDSLYEENKGSYVGDETRNFERFAFDKKDDADKAWNMLNRGDSSSKVAKAFSSEIENIQSLKRGELVEQVGKDLFSIKMNKASQIYSTGEKYYIYKLVGINAPKEISKEKIKAAIRNDLRNDKLNSPEFYSKIKEMKNKVDDGFGSGKSIEQIAKETGIKIVNFEDVKEGDLPKELQDVIPDEETRKEIVETIFNTEEHQASQTIDSKETDTLSYVVMVKKVEKARIPELNEIEDRVKNDYISEKKREIYMKDIDELSSLDRATAIKRFKSRYLPEKFKISKKDIISMKGGPKGDLKRILAFLGSNNPNFIMTLFDNANGVGNVSSVAIDGSRYMISVLAKVDRENWGTSNSDDEFYQAVSRFLDTSSAMDVTPAILSAFKKTMNINVDYKLLDEVTKNNSDKEGE